MHGATITSDAGLLAFRELDDVLDLTPIASDYLQESRTGRNIRHHLVPLLPQSIYSRLAGYDDANDAERLSQDPAVRVVVTETLTQEDNLKGLALMNPHLAGIPRGGFDVDRCPVDGRLPHRLLLSGIFWVRRKAWVRRRGRRILFVNHNQAPIP